MRHPLAFLSTPFLLLTLLGPAQAAAEPWSDLAAEIGAQLRQVLDLHRQSRAKAARGALTRAYFGLFEGRKMEAAMRMELGARYTYGVEKRFSHLRRGLQTGLPDGWLEAETRELVEILTWDGKRLDAAGIPAEVFPTQG